MCVCVRQRIDTCTMVSQPSRGHVEYLYPYKYTTLLSLVVLLAQAVVHDTLSDGSAQDLVQTLHLHALKISNCSASIRSRMLLCTSFLMTTCPHQIFSGKG
ncbi:unnamed protein product [Ectocarpus sp. 12 AP-2014]